MSLSPEHHKETHFLERRNSVDDFGWYVELDQRCVKSSLDALAMNRCKSVVSLGSKGQGGATLRLSSQIRRNIIESSDQVLESVSI